MGILRIQGSLSEERIEDFYDHLTDKQLEIMLAGKDSLKGWELGNELSLIQFLFTWAKKSKKSYLRVYAQGHEDAEKQFRKNIIRPYFIVALLISDEVRSIDKKKSLKSIGSEIADERITNSFLRNSLKNRYGGERVNIFCPDFKAYWNHPLLYDNEHVKTSLSSITEIILSRVISRSQRININSITENLKTILLELFTNTHKWARHDSNLVPIKKSVRGFTIERQNNSVEHFDKITKESFPLNNFLNGLGSSKNIGKNIDFLEISVFDSGIGLAQKWSKKDIKDITLSEEYKYCIACFEKHKSSSQQLNFGLGLHKVMETLTKAGGFLKIRSGRLTLYRDFISAPYEQAKEIKPYLYDWDSQKRVSEVDNEVALTKKHEAVGTCYTILMPLDKSII